MTAVIVIHPDYVVFLIGCYVICAALMIAELTDVGLPRRSFRLRYILGGLVWPLIPFFMIVYLPFRWIVERRNEDERKNS